MYNDELIHFQPKSTSWSFLSTYFQKFINKETLAVLLYQAMVTLLRPSLYLEFNSDEFNSN